MSTSTLSSEWSLDSLAPAAGTPSTCTPPDPKTILLNSLILNRWGIHFLSAVIDVVPPSQDRLRNEGLIPFYEFLIGTNRTMKGGALKKGVSVPPYPDVREDWADEYALDDEALRAALFPHVTSPASRFLEFVDKSYRERKQFHWGSLAAQISVGAGVASNVVADGKSAIAKMACDEAGLWKECATAKPMGESMAIIGEELLKCRSDAAGTGWREEEAKELVTEHVRILKTFWMPPSAQV